MGELKKAYGEHGFEILGIASDKRSTLEDFFKKKGSLPWPNILDEDRSITDPVKLSAYPTYFLIDQSGRHVASPLNVDEIGDLIADLLGIDPITISSKK